MTQSSNPFRYFNSSPEVICLVVIMYVKFQLSLRNLEDLLAERGIDVSYETIRFWWNRFGPMFAAEIRRKRVERMRAFTHWRWHLDEVYVKIGGEMHYLWRAVDHESEVLEPGAWHMSIMRAYESSALHGPDGMKLVERPRPGPRDGPAPQRARKTASSSRAAEASGRASR
jgi:hypothetical protein